MDILSQFIKDYLSSRTPQGAPQQGHALPSARDAEVAHEIMLAHSGDALPLDEATRERIRPHQNEVAPELLDECAAGLREHTMLAAATGADPQALLALAGQGTAIGGVVKGWERFYDGADLGFLLLSEEADLAMDEIDDALRDNMHRLPPGKWSALANIFGEAIRLRLQIEADRAGPTSASPQAQQARKKVEKMREQLDRSDQVSRFLAAVESGEIA